MAPKYRRGKYYDLSSKINKFKRKSCLTSRKTSFIKITLFIHSYILLSEVCSLRHVLTASSLCIFHFIRVTYENAEDSKSWMQTKYSVTRFKPPPPKIPGQFGIRVKKREMAGFSAQSKCDILLYTCSYFQTLLVKCIKVHQSVGIGSICK